MKKTFVLLLLLSLTVGLKAQQKVGDRWVDNNLSLAVVNESIKKDGKLTICVMDTSRNACIENLQTGFELKVYDASDKMIWEGIGSGRTKQVTLPRPLPQASYVTIKAFKPYVTNKRTGTLIHQDKPIQSKHKL
jgi:hypothetical protein